MAAINRTRVLAGGATGSSAMASNWKASSSVMAPTLRACWSTAETAVTNLQRGWRAGRHRHAHRRRHAALRAWRIGVHHERHAHLTVGDAPTELCGGVIAVRAAEHHSVSRFEMQRWIEHANRGRLPVFVQVNGLV